MTARTQFQGRKCYARKQIHAVLGGSEQFFLPHTDGKVVCACLKRELNPDAPDIALPGKGPERERWAEEFAKQGGCVPVFIKARVNCWEFVGEYRVKRSSRDRAEIMSHQKRSDRNDIYVVLFLERCPH